MVDRNVTSQLANEYLDTRLAEGRFNPKTAHAQAKIFSLAERMSGVPVEDMTVEHLRAFVHRRSVVPRRRGQSLSFSSYWNAFSVLRQFYLWLDEEYEGIDPAVREMFASVPVKWKRDPMPCYSLEDVAKIYRTAAEKNSPARGARNSLMVLFGYFLAMRISSIVSIRLESIDWDEATCWADVKGYEEQQRFDIPPAIMPLLERFVKVYRPKLFKKHSDKGFLFPSNRGDWMRPAHCCEMMQETVAKAGVNRTRYRGFHGLRGAGLTHAMTVDDINLRVVQIIAKHQSIDTTAGYINPTMEEIKQIQDRTSRPGLHWKTRMRIEERALKKMRSGV
jgi:integrase